MKRVEGTDACEQVWVEPYSGLGLFECDRVYKKIHIEICNDDLYDDEQVDHLNQMAGSKQVDDKKKKKGGAKKGGKSGKSGKKEEGDGEKAEGENGSEEEEEKGKKGKKNKKPVKKENKKVKSEAEIDPDQSEEEEEEKQDIIAHDDAYEREKERFRHILDRYENYEYIRKVGDGSLGEVILVRDNNTGSEVTLYV